MEHAPLTPERRRAPKSETAAEAERLPEVERSETPEDDQAERLREAEARLEEELRHEKDPLERAKLIAAATKQEQPEQKTIDTSVTAEELIADVESMTAKPSTESQVHPIGIPKVHSKKQLKALVTALVVIVAMILVILAVQQS